MALRFPDFFGTRAALETRKQIAQIELASAREKTARAKALSLAKMFSRNASASLSGLESELYPNAEKSSGSLTRTAFLYNSDNRRLQRLSRMAIFESPVGAAMVGRLAEVVVGAGLRLRPQPYWDIIDPAGRMSEEARAKWVKNVDQRYRMWSKSYSPEYNTRRNLPQLSRACFDYLLQDGEYFALLRYANTSTENPLTIQLIPPENVTGGHATTEGGECVNGIEYDSYGQAIAYWIRDDKTGQETRHARFGSKSGRVMVIHNYLSTNEKQRRGVPYLANIIEELVKIGQYESLEIQAAIVNAMFAMWIEPPDDQDGEPVMPGGNIKRGDAQTETVATDPNAAAKEYIATTNTSNFSKGGIILDALPAAHKPHSFDSSRPNVNFDAFCNAVKKNISASKNIPLSVVDMVFNNSYSGARGELLLFWMSVTRFRENHGYDFEDDIYQMWFLGEVSRGRISAPGVSSSKELFLAYTNAVWIGNQRPDIDPKKSVDAHILEQRNGYKTGAEITAERTGGDYNENLVAITSELQRLAEANEPMERIKQPEQPNDGDGDGDGDGTDDNASNRNTNTQNGDDE